MGRPDTADVWTRLWGNRTVRLAWAATVGCLLFGHVVLTQAVRVGPATPAMPLAVVAGADDDLTEVATLPRLTAHLPGFVIAPRTSISTTDEPKENEETS